MLPFGFRESDRIAYVNQVRDMISWLEGVTGRRMDWDRLKESVRIEKKVYELERDIERMRQAVPSPMKHRSFMEQYQTDMMLPGTPQNLHYYQTVHDEIKGFVEKGIHPLGPDHKEKYRIISCFMPPNWCRSLLDWMEKEHGISSVAEPHMNEWSAAIADDIDPDKPLESLALKYQNHLIIRQLCAPMMVSQLPDTLKHVKNRQVDGAIYYASVTCNTSPHLLTCLKDALDKQAQVPMLILDNDVLDPAYVGMDEMKERIEGFLEVMDSWRSIRGTA
jgi:benzoyl-CoA reductase/2-hydroxyglutaryl-CoA dehydratase subunit BcrC/BadD/HgdB